ASSHLRLMVSRWIFIFFFQAEDGIRDRNVTGVQTCALPILAASALPYFFSSMALKKRKATAGSVVVPDLEMTLTEKSWSPSRSMTSWRLSPDRPLPVKSEVGVVFMG